MKYWEIVADKLSAAGWIKSSWIPRRRNSSRTRMERATHNSNAGPLCFSSAAIDDGLVYGLHHIKDEFFILSTKAFTSPYDTLTPPPAFSCAPKPLPKKLSLVLMCRVILKSARHS
jgi:hypothetical protein